MTECPHCCPPTAERLAAENAARVAREAAQALLAGPTDEERVKIAGKP